MPRAVRASLTLLPSDRGGRLSPIATGYRSLVRFDGTEVDVGFELELDFKAVAPGDHRTGRLSFWAADEIPATRAGQRFEIREGDRVVGHGRVLASDG